MAIRTNGKPKDAAPGASLYEVIKGIDFEKRELLGKPRGRGLFDLVRDRDGKLRCYACTLCERACPTDCIEIDYCPEHPELPFDAAAAREAALNALPPGASCGAGSACLIGEEPTSRMLLPEIDMKLFDAVAAKLRDGSGLIEALHTTQETFGWLPRRALEEIAAELKVPFSKVYGVASFYNQFRLEPVGKYVISVCLGTACHVAGAPLVVEAFARELELEVGGTTPDMLFTLQTVNCVGACALAPAVRIGDEETHGRMTPASARKLVTTLRRREEA